MQALEENTIWVYCNHKSSPETTVFDTYLEEYRSRNSTPNSLIHKPDIKKELEKAIEEILRLEKEIALVKQIKNFELRKNLLKVIQIDQKSNKKIVKQAITMAFTDSELNETKVKMIAEIEKSPMSRFILVVNGFGKRNPPVAVYAGEECEMQKIFGSEKFPDFICEESLRFTLKYEVATGKFKVLKTKAFVDGADAVILR